jgi:hypothetical protein
MAALPARFLLPNANIAARRRPNEEHLMADAYVIEADDLTAGIAIREHGGFRFYASSTPFWDLDQRKFRHLQEIRIAARRALSPVPEPPATITEQAPVAAVAKFVDCIYA